jgi:hypothetical protein
VPGCLLANAHIWAHQPPAEPPELFACFLASAHMPMCLSYTACCCRCSCSVGLYDLAAARPLGPAPQGWQGRAQGHTAKPGWPIERYITRALFTYLAFHNPGKAPPRDLLASLGCNIRRATAVLPALSWAEVDEVRLTHHTISSPQSPCCLGFRNLSTIAIPTQCPR